MLLADTRTSLQVASAQGMAKSTDFSLGGLGFGGGAVGAYENAAEGQVVASGFLDNWNNIVRAIRNNPDMQRSEISLKGPSGKPGQAGGGFQSGDILTGKIGGLKIYAEANKQSKVVAAVKKGDELVFTGEEKNGLLSVESNDGSGWVDKNLVKRN